VDAGTSAAARYGNVVLSGFGAHSEGPLSVKPLRTDPIEVLILALKHARQIDTVGRTPPTRRSGTRGVRSPFGTAMVGARRLRMDDTVDVTIPAAALTDARNRKAVGPLV